VKKKTHEPEPPVTLHYESDWTLRRACSAPWAVPSFTIRNLLAELIERRERDQQAVAALSAAFPDRRRRP
jgi:hypothetical protein